MTILLVDDEPIILEDLRFALEEVGYVVRATESGSEALAHLSNAKSEIQALVTDIRMPEVDGWAIARRARSLGQMPIIYITGGNDHEWGLQSVSGSRMLQKPFFAHRLVAELKELGVQPVQGSGRGRSAADPLGEPLREHDS